MGWISLLITLYGNMVEGVLDYHQFTRFALFFTIFPVYNIKNKKLLKVCSIYKKRLQWAVRSVLWSQCDSRHKGGDTISCPVASLHMAFIATASTPLSLVHVFNKACCFDIFLCFWSPKQNSDLICGSFQLRWWGEMGACVGGGQLWLQFNKLWFRCACRMETGRARPHAGLRSSAFACGMFNVCWTFADLLTKFV